MAQWKHHWFSICFGVYGFAKNPPRTTNSCRLAWFLDAKFRDLLADRPVLDVVLALFSISHIVIKTY